MLISVLADFRTWFVYLESSKQMNRCGLYGLYKSDFHPNMGTLNWFLKVKKSLYYRPLNLCLLLNINDHLFRTIFMVLAAHLIFSWCFYNKVDIYIYLYYIPLFRLHERTWPRGWLFKTRQPHIVKLWFLTCPCFSSNFSTSSLAASILWESFPSTNFVKLSNNSWETPLFVRIVSSFCDMFRVSNGSRSSTGHPCVLRSLGYGLCKMADNSSDSYGFGGGGYGGYVDIHCVCL